MCTMFRYTLHALLPLPPIPSVCPLQYTATTIPARTTGAVIPLVVVKVMVSGVDGLILRYVGNI